MRFFWLQLQLALDHHLRGDAGMVHADHPQGVLALHPRVAGEDVLQRVVERVADVQAPVTLGGGMTMVHGVGVAALGPEQAAAFPMRVPALLDRRRARRSWEGRSWPGG